VGISLKRLDIILYDLSSKRAAKMATAAKTKYDETIDEIMDGIAKHLSSLPADERRKRIKAAASYSFEPQPRRSKTSIRRNGTGRALVRRRAAK
jgi:hypothetical protein